MNKTIQPVRAPDLRRMKRRGEKIAMLTAYDFTMARLLDRAGVDVLLVGDSLGMVVLGYETTVPVTLDMMVHHAAAAARGAQRALVVADMPFMTYRTSVPAALSNAARLIQQGGAAAVKIEGGHAVLEVAQRLVESGIPVMGHLGLTPQAVHQLGGFRKQAKHPREASRLLTDARALEAAGVFAVVLEAIPEDLAAEVSGALEIPTIGIGAGPYCDGQVLVSHDVFGLYDECAPGFVKQYAQLGRQMTEAAEAYAREVRRGDYPAAAKSRKRDSISR